MKDVEMERRICAQSTEIPCKITRTLSLTKPFFPCGSIRNGGTSNNRFVVPASRVQVNDGTAGQGTCETLSFGTGFRNISAALVVVSSNFWNPWILFMVLGIVIDGIIFMMVFGGAIYPELPEKIGALFQQTCYKCLFFGNTSLIPLELKV